MIEISKSYNSNKWLKYLYSLKNMKRYNNTMTIKDESVAEHSFFVALFTLFISIERGESNDQLLKNLIIALCHDLPEIEISDIPHNIKVKNPELNKLVENEEVEWYDKYMPTEIKKIVENDFKMGNDVLLADVLSVVQYCNNEIALGNNNFKEILDDANQRVNNLEKERGVEI